MWLIDTTTLELKDFQVAPIDTYAILSHVWGSNSEELDFDEFKAGQGRHKVGFYKIQKCCEQAKDDGLRYAWVDTCCIDKRSSTELSEAINSMFAWYQSAKVCYAYLADVFQHDANARSFHNSRWFTRGWTLQELIAPRVVQFYTNHWERFGSKAELAEELHAITMIDQGVLSLTRDFLDCSIAQRMSWASGRQTTRIEDTAYCLLGLFRASMPLLYGEGAQAFTRLQEKIIEDSDDESIFAWSGVDERGSGLLASSPAHFADSTNIHRRSGDSRLHPYSKTNRGLSIELKVVPCAMNTYVVPLRCELMESSAGPERIVIFLCLTSEDGQYRRIPFEGQCIDVASKWDISKGQNLDIFVPNEGRALELAPHSGLPCVYIESNLTSTWYFPEYSDEAREMAQSDLRVEVSDDLEHRVSSHETSDSDSVPRKVAQVQFKPQELETGIVIAFNRSHELPGPFHSFLEIGFDFRFRPVCVLHTFQFNLRSGVEFFGMYTYIRGTEAPLQQSLWLPQDPRTGKRLFDHKKFQRCFRSAGLSELRPWSIHMSWLRSWLMLQCDTLRHWIERSLQHAPYLWRTTGDRNSGIRLYIKDQLPVQYGCMNVELEFRPVDGLYWQLKFKEASLHTESHRLLGICWQRQIAQVLKPSRAMIIVYAASISLFIVTLNKFSDKSWSGTFVATGLLVNYYVTSFLIITFRDVAQIEHTTLFNHGVQIW